MTKNVPIQPLVVDNLGVVRFQTNEIVKFLLEQGPFNLNSLATMPFQAADREQLAMLLGNSIGGFGELSYVRDKTWSRVHGKARRFRKKRKNKKTS